MNLIIAYFSEDELLLAAKMGAKIIRGVNFLGQSCIEFESAEKYNEWATECAKNNPKDWATAMSINNA